METLTDVLLVTANVGSLFDNLGEIQKDWLGELYTTVNTNKPSFIALHFQEVGGKEYEINMPHAEKFFSAIESSSEMADFDRVCVYLDTEFEMEDNFTALGSMYFIHKSVGNINHYDFTAKKFNPVSGRNKYIGSLDGVTTVEKEKFPRDLWKEKKWTRKGYMRTRWEINEQEFDLVNVHLFHDPSNLEAHEESPSVYSKNRKRALEYVFDRISNDFFLFGDFNFRLDIRSLVKELATSAEMHVEKNIRTKELELISYKKKDDDYQIFEIKQKLFRYQHKQLFREDSGQELLKFDKEMPDFGDRVAEEPIHFLPSYPYSEDHGQPTQYMDTRCPSWCDRILMSHSAQKIIHRSDDGKYEVVYNIMGQNVCMGDHKPVFLFFTLKSKPCDDKNKGAEEAKQDQQILTTSENSTQQDPNSDPNPNPDPNSNPNSDPNPGPRVNINELADPNPNSDPNPDPNPNPNPKPSDNSSFFSSQEI